MTPSAHLRSSSAFEPPAAPTQPGGAANDASPYRAAIEASPDAWLFLRAERDGRGRVIDFTVGDANPRATALLGTWRRLAGLRAVCARVAEDGVAHETELPDGAAWWQATVVAVPSGVAVTLRDISERKRVEIVRERLGAILEVMPDIVALSDVDGRLLYVNRAGRAMLGLPLASDPDPSYDLTVADLQPQFLSGGALRDALRRAVRDGAWRGETTLHKRDGRELPVEQVLLAHAGSDGAPAFFSSVMRDITDRKQAEAALRSLSLVDELTGLYNRRGFNTVAGQALDRARERGSPVLVFYMDLDDFKRVNDQHGHAEGDAALVAVADALRATFRESDVVGRIGGDEFVAFAAHGAGMDSDSIARTVVGRLEQRLAALDGTSGRSYPLRVSVGVSRALHGVPGAPVELESLLAEADAALYAEKCRRKVAREAAR